MATASDKSTRKARARLWSAMGTFIGWLARAEPIYGIAGPIFERDLRVSGRRRRNYILRFVYLAMLGWFVAMAWLSMVTLPAVTTGFSARASSNMAQAGITLTTVIIWFQFLVLPTVAVVMLSTSISDEVRRRTLGVLMTAPINSRHIVLGKFLGKMVQLALLLAISVPLLVVVRVLGGVTWQYVLAGTCITLVTIMVAGALSLYFSISGRGVPAVILEAMGAMLVMFLGVPLALEYGMAGDPLAGDIVSATNPFVALFEATGALYSARTAGPGVHWAAHCLAMLGMTAAILAVSTVRVRRAALRQLVGEPGRWWQGGPGAASGRIRRVRGSPVAWKESRGRIYRSRVRGILGTGLVLVALGVTYYIVGTAPAFPGAARGSFGWFDEPGVHIAYACILIIYGVLYTAVVASVSVTAEKESGTWPILLVTPLDEASIVFGKAVGALRRSVPGWIPLAFHMAFFAALGLIHPVAIPLVLAVAFGVASLLTGSGVLLGVLIRRTAVAAAGNVLFSFFLWVLWPMMASMALGVLVLFSQSRMLAVVLLLLHPLFQVGLVLSETAGSAGAARSLAEMKWQALPDPSFGSFGIVGAAGAVFTLAAIHLVAAWMFGRWAAGSVRKGAI